MSNKQLRIARKHFPAQKRNERFLTPSDIAALPNTGISVPAPLLSFEHKGKTYVVRTEGKANSFGIGKIVSLGVAVFASDDKRTLYGMSRERLTQTLEQKSF